MTEPIEHDGVVLYTVGPMAHVKIVQASACSGCHAKGNCMSADAQEKEMDCRMLEPMQKGDEVVVEIAEQMGWKAVGLAYIGPFLLMVAVVAGLSLGTEWPEAWVGLAALATTACYYGVLRLFKGRIEKQFDFRARKKNH